MKKTTAISIAALVAALAVTPALALDVNVGAGVNVGVNASSDDGDSNAGADLGVDVGVGVGVDTDTDGDDNGLDADVSAGVSGAISADGENGDSSLNLDAMLQLIADADYSDDSFSTWTDASVTSVVVLDDLFDADSRTQIDAAVEANLDEQDDLRAAINANASLKAWLESNDVDADSVIAIDVAADGSVEVYEG